MNGFIIMDYIEADDVSICDNITFDELKQVIVLSSHRLSSVEN